MATHIPEEHAARIRNRTHPMFPGDEIVISGISGRFPNSWDIAEFSHNLYNKIDMVDDREVRYRHTNPDIPKRMGTIEGLQYFDAPFFGVHARQAHSMDPQCRLLLEHAYEAVLDAGINPKAMRGTRTGVYIGNCFSESEKTWFYEKVPPGGVGLTGCARAMLANRISYTMGLTGPSLMVDTACSSSLYALDLAFNSLRNGECDAALVGGVNLLLHPHVTLQFARLGVLSDDGICRPFDENANGYTRSEACCVIFLQRARDSKRVYGTLVYTKSNCDGFKVEGITYPSGKVQAELLSDFYKEIDLNPCEVDYIEAHSTGTVVGDPEECGAIDEIFCKGRDRPLPVGSVKSNIGHSEPSSGACSIAKVVLAYHTGLIPPNINFTKGRSTIPSLSEGRLVVVTEPTPLEGPLVAINSFGFGGANSHVLLKGNLNKKINHGIPNDPLPRLVVWSGRTKEACDVVIDDISKRPLDAEFIALLNNIQTETIPANVYRGYGVFINENGENAICKLRETERYPGLKRPLIWVFSGMGSQWAEMGTSLMKIPRFKQTIDKLNKVMVSKGLDLINILTSSDPKVFDNILHSFVGIAATQIAIVDMLRELDIKPDYIIGHSVGELGCAYADGCLTDEEMILCAYSRGMASLETEVIFGSMAAIGMGYQDIRTMLPQGIEVACRNGPDSCTISGPAELVAKFVEQLKEKNVFAREVPCSNIAYHSKYIAKMGPNLLTRLKKVILEPKQRSSKWLSSSVPKSRWDLPENQICSAEYQTNNLLSPVLFEETVNMLPKNAITVEIAPHGLLQAILKRSMQDSVHVSLTQRGNKDNINFFFSGLGKLYMNGIDIPVQRMYPPVEFPVSSGTPMISPLIKWDHSEEWFTAKFDPQLVGTSGERMCNLSLSDHDFEYVGGHIIDGRCLFPATGYLSLVWETLGMMHGRFFLDFSIQFSDIKFLRATTIVKDQEVTFCVMIQRGTGDFEISEDGSTIATGNIQLIEDLVLPELETLPKPSADVVTLDMRDFYKELRLRGYHYKDEFKAVVQARTDGLGGKIAWNINFATFMDCMLQLNIVAYDTRNLMIPTAIERIRVDPNSHFTMAKQLKVNDEMIFDVHIDPYTKTVRSGGVEIRGLNVDGISRRKPPGEPVLESYKFIPNFPTPVLSDFQAARVIVQLAQENTHDLKVKTVELDDLARDPIVHLFSEALGDLPLVTAESILVTTREITLAGVSAAEGEITEQLNCNIIIVPNLIHNQELANNLLKNLKEHAYLVSREAADLDPLQVVIPSATRLVCVVQTERETLLVMQYIKQKVLPNFTVVKVSSTDTDFNWIQEIKDAIVVGPVVVVAQNEPYSGILGLVNCLRAEPNGQLITCFFIDDPEAPPFDPEHPLYLNQKRLGLAINVFRDGQWGTYRHLSIESTKVVKPESRPCFANITTKGDLSSLRWLDRPTYMDEYCKEGATLVKVQYAALNFRDVMLATGKLTEEVLKGNRIRKQCIAGFEYSGITSDNRRVMGMLLTGALASHAVSMPNFTFSIPESWTLEQAATVTTVYSTVYMAFFMRAHIKKGEKILIHAGTGGVGLAAIRVALVHGLEVFTTVSTQVKRDYLLKKFPELKPSHIGNSRDTSFYEMIMRETKGNGVNYVLNSLAEDKLLTSLKCLGFEGQFLEIGKYDIMKDNKMGLGNFSQSNTFHAIFVDLLMYGDEEPQKHLQSLMEEGFRNGTIIPLDSTVYEASHVEEAFRYLASGKHIGKVLVKIRDNEFDQETLPIQLVPRYYCDSAMSYIIPGGLGGFGLELADWLVLRGCKKLVLSSSRGITRSYQEYRIQIWKTYGVQVVVSVSDITTPRGCLELITESKKLGPVGGIFNLAVRLKDAIFENQDAATFSESLAVKALATKYLDEVSRKLCPELQQFVVFSSVSCGRGNVGQTNYGMANSIMERIIESRHAAGLPAKAIQWGAVGEVGLVADMQEDRIDIEIGGTLQQRISSCLQELDTLLATPDPIVASMVVAEKRLRGGSSNAIEAVMNIMSLRDMKSISMDTKLAEMGMDSLMAVEIKQTLERDFEIFLSPQDVRGLTFGRLQELMDAQKDQGPNIKAKQLQSDSASGIELILRNFGDGIDADKPLLRLESKSTTNSTMLIIPGVEGTAGEVWRRVSSELTQTAYMLQLLQTSRFTDLSEILQAVTDDVAQQIFKNCEFFYIVGYSFGSLIALDLAQKLEARGMTGQVLLIDGAPMLLKRLATDTSGAVSEDLFKGLEELTMLAGIKLMFSNEEQEYWNKISVEDSYEARVEKYIELSEDRRNYSAYYTRETMIGVLNRIKMAATYKLDHFEPIKSDITLLRPNQATLLDIEEDYGVAAYTKGQFNLKFIEGNHATILENPQLLDIINECDPVLKTERTFTEMMRG